MSESTDEKVMGNFRVLIDQCAADAGYVPTNPAHAIDVLNPQYTAGLAAVEDVDVKLMPNKVARNERRSAYDEVDSLFRRSRNYLKSTGASDELLENAASILRKITGVKKTKIQDDPSTPENEAAQQHSASQQSYESILGNCRAYIELIKNEPLYTTTDSELKITALEEFCDGLEAKNNAVSSTFPPVSQSRGTRDDLLYDNPNCIINTALAIKAYTKSMADDTLYNAIRGLKFPRRQK